MTRTGLASGEQNYQYRLARRARLPPAMAQGLGTAGGTRGGPKTRRQELHMFGTSSEMTLYARNGARKYVNRDERERFLRAADAAGPKTRTFCMTLAYTGCRISEALTLTTSDIQPEARIVSIRTLKKRRAGVVREVPVPAELVSALDTVHSVSRSSARRTDTDGALWPWGRTTAWERVKDVMATASIAGPHATPRGLRHGYGVHAIQTGVPLNLVQKWLGHASLSTTAIYANAVGPEEQAIASRMW